LNDLQADEPRAITDGPFGSNLTSAHYTDSGPRVVRLQNIGDGVFHDLPAHISEEHFKALRAHEVLPGDLLVASLGETLPRACLAPASLGPAIVKADCIRVRLSPAVDSRWVMYAIQRPRARKWADEHRHGVGRPRLGLKVIRQIPVPLPPLDEQRRIVNIIEDHLSRLDAAIRGLSLADQRTAAYKATAAVTALEAAGGEYASIAAISTSVRNGIFVSRAKPEPNGVPILRIGAVRPLSLDLTDLRYSERDRDDLAVNDALLDGGDLLFTRYNGNPRFVGACAMVPQDVGDLTYPDKLIRVKIDRSAAEPGFVALACSFGEGRRQIQSKVKTTSGQAGISGTDLKRIAIRLPDLPAQAEVMERIQEALDHANRIAVATDAARRRGTLLRRALLDAAFSGRLTGRAVDMELVEELAGV
jgi:type I restriction enzyme S subunit